MQINHESNLSYARNAGILYLVIFVTAFFAEGFVRSAVFAPNDAAVTAQNILNSQGLFRTALVADLIAFISDAIIAVLFYLLFKPVNKPLALIVAILRLLAHPAIGSINLVNHLSALQVLIDPVIVGGIGLEHAQALAMQYLTAHKTGYLIAGAFFGVQCALLGYLIVKSELISKIIGYLMIVASIGYLVESFGGFLFPQHSEIYSMIVMVPAVVAEGSLAFWLLIKGVRARAIQH